MEVRELTAVVRDVRLFEEIRDVLSTSEPTQSTSNVDYNKSGASRNPASIVSECPYLLAYLFTTGVPVPNAG